MPFGYSFKVFAVIQHIKKGKSFGEAITFLKCQVFAIQFQAVIM